MTELSTNHLDGNFGVTFKIKTALNEVRHAFVYIGFLLDEADRLEYYREKGYESIYEYCEIELGFKKSSTNNFIRIYQHFGEAMGLQSKYQAYSYSQLTEMCSMNDRQLRLCSPEMTVRELREIKRPSSGSRDHIFQTSGKEDKLNYSTTGPVMVHFPRKFILDYFKKRGGVPADFDSRYAQTMGMYNDALVLYIFTAMGYHL